MPGFDPEASGAVLAAALRTAEQQRINRDFGGALPELPRLGSLREARGFGPRLSSPPKLSHPPQVTKLHVGPIHSGVAGRTDHLPVHVPSGSYVLPAHHVSALGESNTIAGFKVLKRIFNGLPYSGGGLPYGQNSGPYGAEISKSSGGSAANGAPVACVLAGGEFVVAPSDVAKVGGGDQAAGHKILDEWVKRQTEKTAKTIKNLPPPRRD